MSSPISASAAALDVLVAGSVNVDVAVNVATLPAPGETVVVTDARPRALGGKGANQAVAAAAMGASVGMAGAIGDDEGGTFLHAELSARNVSTKGLRSVPGRSGWAHVLVAPDGENLIVVDPGANSLFTPDVARTAVRRYRPRVVLAQLEIPLDSAYGALAQGRDVGAITVCNASPALDLDLLRDRPVDIVIVNRSEACRIAGIDDADRAGARLAGLVADTLITTLGGDGASIRTSRGMWHVPARTPTRVVDTTGAGDVFAGVLAAELARGSTLGAAAELAVHAASWSVAHAGVTCPQRSDLTRPGSASEVMNGA